MSPLRPLRMLRTVAAAACCPPKAPPWAARRLEAAQRTLAECSTATADAFRYSEVARGWSADRAAEVAQRSSALIEALARQQAELLVKAREEASADRRRQRALRDERRAARAGGFLASFPKAEVG